MEKTEENRRICRRCLTRESADQAEIYHSLRERIDALDEDVRAGDELYQRRLERCKECDMLLQGMCRSCGCYVELRAAVKNNCCPRKHW